MEYQVLNKVYLPKRKGWDVITRFTDDIYAIDTVMTFFWLGELEPTDDDLQPRLEHIGNNLIASTQEEIE